MATADPGSPGDGVAVIGAALRVPGASDVATFWANLVAGEVSIERFARADAAPGYSAAATAMGGFVGAEGVLYDVDMLDTELFGYSPREAQIADPQHRLLLECGWEALEVAGHRPRREPARVGVFVGAAMSSYLVKNLLPNDQVMRSLGGFSLLVHNDKDFAASNLSYRLDLGGPSMVVGTACSSSLVAIHMACQSLLMHECDMALGGGTSVQVPQRQGSVHLPGGVYSADGVCRPFDAAANGFVGGSGVGVVVLKRLHDAIEDGDRVWAVVRGSAVSNDGANKIGLTAPGFEGQVRAIVEAQEVAEVDPVTIGLVEAHGAGTILGDPVEVAALSSAFGRATDRTGWCALGSLKANVGHLDAAAGVAAFLKAVLAVEHGVIPPNPTFTRPNPELHLDASPFFVNTEALAWESPDHPRRACVSSLGVGGTNAHVVVEQAPAPACRRSEPLPRQLVLVSGHTRAALEAACDRLAGHLEPHTHRDGDGHTTELELRDVARTLAVGRVGLGHRRAFVAGDVPELVVQLRDRRGLVLPGAAEVGAGPGRDLVFAFPGHAAERSGMAATLYRHLPVVREEIDRCSEVLLAAGERDPRDALLAPMDEAELLRPSIAHPAVVVLEWALTRLLLACGLRPSGLVGHSLGELTAATVAEVMALDDALRLVARRSRLFEATPGAMAAVDAHVDDVRSLLGDELDVAAINSPTQTVVSGTAEAVERFEQVAERQGVLVTRLRGSTAAHCRLLHGEAATLRDLVVGMTLRPPSTPYISNVTGDWATDQRATSADAWAEHLVAPVRFDAGIGRALAGGATVVEVGPGRALSSLARANAEHRHGQLVVPVLGRADAGDEVQALSASLGRLWASGFDVDLEVLHVGQDARRVPLPTYPFQRQRAWIDAPPTGSRSPAAPHGRGDTTVLAALPRQRQRPEHWLYVPSWRRVPLTAPGGGGEGPVLALVDDPFGEQLADALEQAGRRVVRVAPGTRLRRLGPARWVVDPTGTEHYATVLADVLDDGGPLHVVHAWGVADDPSPDLLAGLASAQARGLDSLLDLIRAFDPRRAARGVHLVVLTSGAQDVLGGDLTRPDRATALAAAKVIPREYVGVQCTSIDVPVAPAGSEYAGWLVDQLLGELAAPVPDGILAYRGRGRWSTAVEPLDTTPSAGRAPVLRPGGVYLVAGGLGGLGLATAERLAALPATVVLTGRSPFPEPRRWRSIAEAGPDDSATAERARRLLAMEAAGGRPIVRRADVTQLGQMQALVDEVTATWGPVRGVVHAAGVVDLGGLIQRRTGEATRAATAAKVSGALVLDRLFRERPLDFFVLFSSISSVLYKLKFAEVGYVAGNDFLAAFASWRAATHGDATSIAWTDWPDDGMAADARDRLVEQYQAHTLLTPSGERRFLGHDIFQGLSRDEGVATFERALGRGQANVLVSTLDLHELLGVHEAFTTRDHSDLVDTMQLRRSDQRDQEAPARRQPTATAVAAATPLEIELASWWRLLLGVEAVHADDNFFELGGDSLIALRLLAMIQGEFGIEYSMQRFFELPDLRAVATDIAGWTGDGGREGREGREGMDRSDSVGAEDDVAEIVI